MMTIGLFLHQNQSFRFLRQFLHFHDDYWAISSSEPIFPLFAPISSFLKIVLTTCARLIKTNPSIVLTSCARRIKTNPSTPVANQPILDFMYLCSLFGWLVADGWCWFVLREEYCWLVAGGWFVVREKYWWLISQANRAVVASRSLCLGVRVLLGGTRAVVLDT
jgi:hypothetical protein